MCCRRSLSEYWLCQADQFLQSLCWCIHAYCYFACFGHLLSIPLLWILSWTWLTYSRCKHETLLSYIDAATVGSKLFCVKFHNRSGFIKKLNNNNVNQDLGKNLSFQPRKILIYIQQNTDNIFAVLRFNIMTFYHKGLCSVLNGVMYLCCGPCNTSTPSDGRFDIASLPGSMWQTIGFLRSNVVPINPTAAIQAFEGPQWYFSQWKKIHNFRKLV